MTRDIYGSPMWCIVSQMTRVTRETPVQRLRLVFERSFIILLSPVSPNIFRAKVYYATNIIRTICRGWYGVTEIFGRRSRKLRGAQKFDYGPTNRSNVSNYRNSSRTGLFEYDVAQRGWHSILLKLLINLSKKCFGGFTGKAGWNIDQRWNDYVAFDHDTIPERRFQQAVTGKTGIDCFDYWSLNCKYELSSQSCPYVVCQHLDFYAWFTVAVRCQIFMQHLFDGDAASNTLGWRWVAGIQTIGKHYVARNSNIEQFTNGQFST